MTHSVTCPECGASWLDGLTCQDHFHQMLAWENEFSALWEVHHLLVLCYHLQHPSLYSPEGLAGAREMLDDFVLRGRTTAEVRQRNRAALDAGRRQFKLTGTPEAHGAYAQRPPWTLTTPDITAGGPEQYIENVRAWAASTQQALKMQKDEG
jgi:hypothetical protein